MKTPNILIVGAGIAGLSMARQLKAKGVPFTIIEKQAEAQSGGAGIALPFNAVRALKELGVYEQIMNCAHQVQEILYTQPSGKLLASRALTQAPFEHDTFIALKRSDLHKILMEGLEQDIHFSTRLTTIETSEQGNKVVCSNSALNGNYDLVIAADGVNSNTRANVLKHKQTTYEHDVVCWRFISKQNKHQLQPTYMIGKSDVFMAYPISPDELYCYAQIHKSAHSYDHDLLPLDNLKRIFSAYGGPVPKILSSLKKNEIIEGLLKSVIHANYYHQRVVFVGDASNACSPLLQQGAAAAFEDTLCLSYCLNNGDIDQALESYKRIRKKRIEWIINYSDKPFRSIAQMEKNPLVRGIRNLIIKILGPLNVVGWKKLATNQKLAYELMKN